MAKAMKVIWVPLPMTAAKKFGCSGKRNTSACTNFQPVSSASSAAAHRARFYFQFTYYYVVSITNVGLASVYTLILRPGWQIDLNVARTTPEMATYNMWKVRHRYGSEGAQ